jgi:GTP-binding protein Era
MPKAGFITIIGLPNVGKSTLLNSILGERLSAVSFKAQMTRKNILGIRNYKDSQMVFCDTPGILTPNNNLHNTMLKSISGALDGTDVVLYMIDSVTDITIPDIVKPYLATPSFIVGINKIDKFEHFNVEEIINNNPCLQNCYVVGFSAKEKFNIILLLDMIYSIIPQHDFYYPCDIVTDQTERSYASEIIRQHIFNYFDKEVPYCVEVGIDKFVETPKLIHIDAVVYVEKQSHKAILIGKNGRALRAVGKAARVELEKFFNKKVFLTEYVKVEPNWRMNNNTLRRFGYIN